MANARSIDVVDSHFEMDFVKYLQDQGIDEKIWRRVQKHQDKVKSRLFKKENSIKGYEKNAEKKGKANKKKGYEQHGRV